MPSPSVLRAVSALTSRPVTVFAEGKSYVLPTKQEPLPVEPPHPFEAVSKQMLERYAEIRALLTSVAERTDGALNQVKEAVSAVAAGQAEVVQSVRENTRTLRLPVVPAYDKDGKLKAAHRVEE